MKQMKKILCIIMTIAFVFTFVCPASGAYAYTKSITEGEWKNAHSEKDYYKVVIDGEGYITLTSKCEEGVACYEILNSKKHTFSDESFVDGGYNGNKTIKVAVKRAWWICSKANNHSKKRPLMLQRPSYYFIFTFGGGALVPSLSQYYGSPSYILFMMSARSAITPRIALSLYCCSAGVIFILDGLVRLSLISRIFSLKIFAA